MNKAEALQELNYAIQYRRKDGGSTWSTMAAFDVKSAAEGFLSRQEGGKEWHWEYQMVDLSNDG